MPTEAFQRIRHAMPPAPMTAILRTLTSLALVALLPILPRLAANLGPEPAPAPAPGQPASRPAAPALSWTNNLLTFSHPDLPGGSLDIFYLEAFCLPGGHERRWDLTRVPHATRLLRRASDGTSLAFQSTVGPHIVVDHTVRALRDGLEMHFTLVNRGKEPWAVHWFQPACVRVDRFTGADQSHYTARSFVFTDRGLTWLAGARRNEEALYRGGQVFLPPWIQATDANPRPISPDRVTQGIIGCVSKDDRWLLAIASDRTFELFEGVYVCLHSDPWIGGLQPGETRRIRQRLYLLPNQPDALLRRYQRDFSPRAGRW